MLIFILLTFVSLALPQWQWLNPTPIGNKMYSVHFSNENNGWISCSGGLVLHTTNEGQNWEVQDTQTGNYLRDVYFINDQEGWVVGDKSTVLKTEDSGNTWISYNNGIMENVNINSVFFINDTLGWICGDFFGIYNTANGGISWERQTIPNIMFPDFEEIQFINDLTGWVVGYDGTYFTNNGGLTWHHLTYWSQYFFTDLHFIDEDIGWLSNCCRIIRTEDGGVSWESLYYDFEGDLIDIQFLDEETGYVLSNDYEIWKTTDGGNNWIQSEVQSENDDNIESFFILDDQNYFVVGKYNLLSTVSGGDYWNNSINNALDDFYTLNDIDKINDSTFIIVGDNSSIIKVTNESVLEIIESPNINNDLNDVYFLDNSIGWIVGDEGIILVSTDQGDSWSTVSSAITEDLHFVYFLNNNDGFAGGGPYFENGVLFSTSDGGITWESIISDTMSVLLDIHYNDYNNNLFVTGKNGVLIKSTDGGNSWEYISGFSDHLLEIEFVDNKGWILTESEIYSSDDNGSTWYTINDDLSALIDVFFINSNIGFASDAVGQLYKTETGGIIWETYSRDSTHQINSMYFSNDSSGIITGYGANILIHSNIDNLEIYDEGPHDQLPTNYSLELIYYPNPFNPITTLRYDLPEQTHVNITVYDMLGRKVRTILNEQQDPGYKSLIWDATNDYGKPVSAGIYLYQIQAGEYMQTKKMVLLK